MLMTMMMMTMVNFPRARRARCRDQDIPHKSELFPRLLLPTYLLNKRNDDYANFHAAKSILLGGDDGSSGESSFKTNKSCFATIRDSEQHITSVFLGFELAVLPDWEKANRRSSTRGDNFHGYLVLLAATAEKAQGTIALTACAQ